MSSPEQPKVILFDIGGVCVLSPFQTVLDYELRSNIPPGWINYSISKSAPDGSWQRLERGEIPLDAAFFRAFNADLHIQSHWEAFYQREAARNPNLTSSSSSIPNPSPSPSHEPNPHADPPAIPPLPRIDGEWLFNAMMTNSQAPDPWVLPALHALRASGQYVLAALSNTFIFPLGHPLHAPEFLADPVRRLFDVFVSSAHVGMRKPEPRMYEHALQELDAHARSRGLPGRLAPRDVLFLDDIGENLKEARRQGFRTIKVPLGRSFEAVDQLEAVTGLRLHGSHPRIAVEPSYTKPKAKI
ncbi:Acyl-CoA dehydrogenase family member 10 [Escovopsis weberi]|uniref:Acyl-CoA dehydrogenase family member 10 n=1 Tax=Escovopsis weberi TaxID=150374 RepID=A0A0M8N5S2_ESCWE|nr:Acyl-CoA dehydrogenase family member 10 [Escovopsis weberi]